MANSSHTQQALAADAQFRQRVKSGLSATAWMVIQEDPAFANHQNRLTYARQVLRQLDQETATVVGSLVMRPNVNNFETSYDFEAGQVVSASGDPDILSQLWNDWDQMAASAGFAQPALAPPEG